MPRRKERNPFEPTEGEVRSYNEQVRCTLGDPTARNRNRGKYARDYTRPEDLV